MTSGAQAELKRDYRRNLEVGFLLALALVLAAFLFFPRNRPETFSGELQPIVFFFPDENSEIPLPPEPVDVPRLEVAHLWEDVEEVRTPFEVPLRTRESAAIPPPPSFEDESLRKYDFAPRPRDIIRPEYPEVARIAGAEGIVRLRVVVSADGMVEDARILDAELAQFGESALRAVRYWTFVPALRDGRPVRASIILPIEFVLTEDDRAG